MEKILSILKEKISICSIVFFHPGRIELSNKKIKKTKADFLTASRPGS
jgi:hypothetical protein